MAELPTAAVTRSSFMRWLIPLVLVACIVGAAAYEWYRGGLVAPGDLPRAVATAPQADPQLPAPLPTESPANPPTAIAPPAGTSSTPLPNPLAAGERVTEPSPALDATLAAAPNATPEAAATPPPLVLSYRGPSWTEVRDRNGQVLIGRLVAAGSEQSIRGTPPFEVVIGNAHVVVLTYHGKPVDLSRYTRQNVARLRLS